MIPLRSKRPASAFTLAALTTLAPSAAPLIAALTTLALAPAPAFAQPPPADPAALPPDPYKKHMENGVKLFQDGNYPSAIVEFQAAYDAKPKASPLINIYLCYKAKFNYPKAIKTLETALEKHGDTMDAADKEASENAVKDMRALLAYVTVKVTPPQATLVVDDEEQPADTAKAPVPLGPGTHKIAARAEGFAQVEQTITVASGDKPEIKFALVADKGWVTVQAPNPRMTIAIDQRPYGTGQWAGMLPPGPHLVQMYGTGSTPLSAQILVVAGKQINVRPPAAGGVPPGTVTPPATPTPRAKKDAPPSTPPPPRRGFYGLVVGSLLVQPKQAPSFPKPTLVFGAEYGVRVGYQVNSYAGFDFTYQHSSILSSSAYDDGQSTYRTISNRFAIGLRLLSTGKVVRFVGALGGGPVLDDITFSLKPAAVEQCTFLSGTSPCPLVGTASGVDAFGYMETGLEFDLDHVLIDAAFELEFQSAGNLGPNGNVFGGATPVNLGPALRVGYRFW